MCSIFKCFAGWYQELPKVLYTSYIYITIMEAVEAQVREWGGSLGVVIPRLVAEKNQLKVGDKIEVLLLKKSNVLQETFGQLRHWKRSTEQIMKEVDEELWRD